jgi:hypothetical protein
VLVRLWNLLPVSQCSSLYADETPELNADRNKWFPIRHTALYPAPILICIISYANWDNSGPDVKGGPSNASSIPQETLFHMSLGTPINIWLTLMNIRQSMLIEKGGYEDVYAVIIILALNV